MCNTLLNTIKYSSLKALLTLLNWQSEHFVMCGIFNHDFYQALQNDIRKRL